MVRVVDLYQFAEALAAVTGLLHGFTALPAIPLVETGHY
jgi:hypothetical protein